MGTGNDKLPLMREGGFLLGQIRRELMAMVRPRVDLMDIETRARVRIREVGAIPNFALIGDYGCATCLMVNDEVVHCKPRHYLLKLGDLVTVDVGLEWKGWQLDTANSKIAGKEDDQFLSTGRHALNQAIAKATIGRRIGHITQAIQHSIEKHGYHAVLAYCGHGIGREIHEDPQIPCASDTPVAQTPLIVDGMTLAIEVMMNEKSSDVVVSADGWRSVTADGSRSAQFEHTVFVTQKGPEVLTK